MDRKMDGQQRRLFQLGVVIFRLVLSRGQQRCLHTCWVQTPSGKHSGSANRCCHGDPKHCRATDAVPKRHPRASVGYHENTSGSTFCHEEKLIQVKRALT